LTEEEWYRERFELGENNRPVKLKWRRDLGDATIGGLAQVFFPTKWKEKIIGIPVQGEKGACACGNRPEEREKRTLGGRG